MNSSESHIWVTIVARIKVSTKESTEMKALIVQHDHVSPTGPVGRRLEHHGFEITEFLVVPEASFHEPNVEVAFPNPDDFDLVVFLGAPWGAWDDVCIGNWLTPELDLCRSLVTAGRPVLGICFGGQLMARAMGGSVAPGDHPEIGWTTIWSDDQSLVGNGPWFQFHYDRWQLPPGATEIARNPVASQAFVINNSLAVQFHPELDGAALVAWIDEGGRPLVLKDNQDPDVMLAQTWAEDRAGEERAYALIDAFLTRVAKLV
jgi:GMP synthase-like glutamine amidotransferase